MARPWRNPPSLRVVARRRAEEGGVMVTSSWVDDWAVSRRGRQGWILAGLLFFVAVAAVFGGVGLIRDGMGMPADWADRLPFGSWTLGGIALLLGVAAPQLAAGWLIVSCD